MKVKGAKNQDLNEVWKNGAEAYLGVTVAGFPNFYILYGPNTNLAHNSIVYMIEAQVRYIISALNEMNKRGIQALIPKVPSMQKYNASLNKNSINSFGTLDVQTGI